ncbi:MAG: hypothetical protein ACFCU5_17255 [Pleurocapsa sp.]
MNLVLETSRLILRPTLAEDLETLHAILIDPYCGEVSAIAIIIYTSLIPYALVVCQL